MLNLSEFMLKLNTSTAKIELASISFKMNSIPLRKKIKTDVLNFRKFILKSNLKRHFFNIKVIIVTIEFKAIIIIFNTHD